MGFLLNSGILMEFWEDSCETLKYIWDFNGILVKFWDCDGILVEF